MTLEKSLVLGCLALASFVAAGSPCHAQEKTKIAEGEYTVINGDPESVGKALDHWVLWKLKDNNLQVKSRVDERGGELLQEFLFTPHFKPIAYGISSHIKGGAGEKDQELFLLCRLSPKLIRCKEEMAGQEERKDTFELSIKEPEYAFLPGEFYLLDVSWFFVSLIQNQRENCERAVYSLAEDDSGKPKLEMDDIAKIHWLGPEIVTVMGKTVQANKYELLDFTVWTAPSNGMMLAIESTDGHGRWELTKFKSYSSAFLPELR